MATNFSHLFTLWYNYVLNISFMIIIFPVENGVCRMLLICQRLNLVMSVNGFGKYGQDAGSFQVFVNARCFFKMFFEARKNNLQLFVPTKKPETISFSTPALAIKEDQSPPKEPILAVCCPDGSKVNTVEPINSRSWYPESSGVVPAAFCPRSISASGRSSRPSLGRKSVTFFVPQTTKQTSTIPFFEEMPSQMEKKMYPFNSLSPLISPKKGR